MTRTKSSRALLSVVLAVLMAAAFMPSLTYSSFAATAKKATKVTKLNHTGAKVYGKVGSKYTLKYKLSPKKLTSSAQKTVWKSSDSSVVKVIAKAGKHATVKVKGVGTAKITVYTKANKKAKAVWTFKTKEAEKKLAVESTKQTGAKTIDVTFNKEVDDTMSFKVAKGAVDQEVASKVLSADKKTVTLTLSSPIQAADYTVTATPATGDALTASFKGEVSKLTTIKFMSDKLAVKANNDLSEGYVTVKGYDQFGAETAISGATFNSSTGVRPELNAQTGKLTVGAGKDKSFTLNQQVVVSAVYDNNTKVANATLTVSTAAYADSFEVGTITTDNTKYKNAKLTVSSLEDGSYYIPVTVKDQYGNEMTASDLNDALNSTLFVTSANPAVASIPSSNPFTTVDKKTVLQVAAPTGVTAMAGDAIINFASVGGKTAQAKFTVADNSKIDTAVINGTATDLSVGKATALNASFKDQDGADVNLFDKTVEGTNGASSLKLTDGTQISVSNGTVTLVKDYAKKTGELKITPNTKGSVVVTVISATYKVTNATFTAGEEAKVDSIKGVKSTVSTQLTNGQSLALTKDSFDYLDQYGNAIKADSNYNIEVTGTGNYSTVNNNNKITAKEDPTKTGTDTYTVTLKKGSDVVTTYDLKVTVVGSDDIEYSIKPLKTLKLHDSNGVTIELVGTLNGKSVAVNQNSIKNVSVNTSDITVAGTKLTVVDTAKFDKESTKTAKVTVLVETANTTKTLTTDLTYTKASVATKAVCTDKDGKDAEQLTLSATSLKNGYSLAKKSDDAEDKTALYIADQSGDPVADATYTVTNKKTKSGEATVTVDNTGKITASNISAGDTFNLTVTKDGVSKTVVVTIAE
jgi:hypothetical protein